MPSHATLVTGATGFIGLSVVAELARRNMPFICAHRRSSNLCEIKRMLAFYDTKCTFCELDFDNPETVCKALEELDIDTVVHLAAVSSWGELAKVDAYNSTLAYTEILVFALQKLAKSINLVYISSAAAAPARKTLVDSPAAMPLNYASAKRDTEAFLLSQPHSLLRRLVILRLGEVYGSYDYRMITANNIQEYVGKRISFTTPGGMSVVHRDDVARTIVNAITMGRDRAVYHVGGENITITELSRIISKICGRGTMCIQMPRKLVKPLALLGRALGLTNYPLQLTEYACTYWFIDNGDAINDLDHVNRPAYETLRDVVHWLQNTTVTQHQLCLEDGSRVRRTVLGTETD